MYAELKLMIQYITKWQLRIRGKNVLLLTIPIDAVFIGCEMSLPGQTVLV